jgi:hypothetical protein
MNSNQRSEMNNQTNNGGNEKGTPGSKGATRDGGPLDHTYPQGAAQQQGSQQAGAAGTQQSGAGPGLGNEAQGNQRGGSMQTQQSGGTGAVQGITDSHQRAMEQRSGAAGELEQPVGGRRPQAGAQAPGSTGSQQSGGQGGTQGGGQRGPLSARQAVQGGSMGSQQSGMQSGTRGGGQAGADTGTPTVRQGGSMSADQATTDRSGSQTGSEQRDAARMQSNDAAGGLPRSPGGTGPTNARQDTHLTGAQVHANQQKELGGVHKSNDAAGGYPKSPGGANKLAADEKMDDDTGFSNR